VTFNQQKDQLFTLIKSLSKAEKRAFRLYVNRFQHNKSPKFIQLFDVLCKIDHYDEELVLKRLKTAKKQHLPNLKRHLYRQILTSLRLIHIQKNIDIQIREQLDFARILYGKGMYMQALKLLDRIKKIAVENHQDILHLEILEFQKLIEARHITRSRLVKNKLEALLEEAAHRSLVTHSSNLFSNFNIQIHGWYIEHGHVKHEEDVLALRDFFEQNMPRAYINNSLTFFEKANLFQAYMWHSYILLDFPGSFSYAAKWVSLFEEYPQMKEKDPGLYMRSLYYILVFCYLIKDAKALRQYLEAFEAFEAQHWEILDDNARMIGFTYLNLSRLNYHFITRQYKAGLSLILEVEKELPRLEATMDLHRILLFQFKFAYLYFCSSQHEKALVYLNEIIHLKSGHLREDLLHNANLLHLLCHFELGNHELLDYLIPLVSRLFEKAREPSEIHLLCLKLLQRLLKSPKAEHLTIYEQYQPQIELLVASPYEQKAVQYIDLLGWVELQLSK
jgi:hypothetical protein